MIKLKAILINILNEQEIIRARISKSYINKIVQWTTSRYNILKKPQVVNRIYDGMKEGGLWEVTWYDKYYNK